MVLLCYISLFLKSKCHCNAPYTRICWKFAHFNFFSSDEDVDSTDKGDLNVKKSKDDEDYVHVPNKNDNKESDEKDQPSESKEESDETEVGDDETKNKPENKRNENHDETE